MQYDGTWIHAKPNDYYGIIELVEFLNGKPTYFYLEKCDVLAYKKSKENDYIRDVLRIEEINQNRLRFYTKGFKSMSHSDGQFINKEIIFQLDYVRLVPTKTTLTSDRIQTLQFDFPLRSSLTKVKFNVDFESDIMKFINEKLNHQGFFMRLGKINSSYLLVFYSNESIDKVIPIEEITNNEIKLYGFPNEPFEMTCPIIN